MISVHRWRPSVFRGSNLAIVGVSVCVQERWAQAYEAGSAPIVIIESTSEAALKHIPRGVLEEFALSEIDE